MSHFLQKTFLVLLLALSAAGCADPYYWHHHDYAGQYDHGYGRDGGYGYTRPWYGSHHHHDSDHDGD